MNPKKFKFLNNWEVFNSQIMRFNMKALKDVLDYELATRKRRSYCIRLQQRISDVERTTAMERLERRMK